MEGCAANTNTPDLIDASGAALKTSKEKGSALLQRFVQQSNQNNLDERKAVWKGLGRTVTETGSNDDMITELEFTKPLSELSKDTVPGPHTAKYSDIKNLSVDNKSGLFKLYEECFAAGQVPDDWSHSYLKPILKARKGPYQAERIPYPHNAEHHGKADATDCGQEACSGLRKKKRTYEDTEQEKPPGKTQPDLHTMSTKDSRGRNKLWPWRSIWKMRTTECNSDC